MKCDKPAVTAATWVGGQRLILCEGCYSKAAGVARALGCVLFTQPQRDGEDKCTQNVKDEPKKGPTDA